MALFIGLLSGAIALYGAKKEDNAPLSAGRKHAYATAGLLVALSSFANQLLSLAGSSARFWNPPYSIGEYAVLLSGLSVAYFAFLGRPSLMLPSGFPAFTITAYQVYELFEKNLEWVAAPLLGPSTQISVLVLNLIGIAAQGTPDYVISFAARDGVSAGVRIVTDCTGIWSLCGYAASVILVASAFPKVLTWKGAVYVAAGFIGTYAANILRIVAICVSMYYDRASGLVNETHMHAGWIAFSGWLLVFWYVFFHSYILKKEPAAPGT